MIVDVAGKYVRREFTAVLICLSLIGNSAYGTVLCFGSDGHIEFEPAFHEQCTDHVHSQSANQSHHSFEHEHEHDRHCHSGQCVDVSICLDLAKISQTREQLNSTCATFAAGVIAAVELRVCCEHLSPLDVFAFTSYFRPLRAVILLA
jgi:hypothetical protein